MANQKKLNKGSAGQNRKLSEVFIDKYRDREEVIATSSGLLYRIIDDVSGMTPTLADCVVVNQRILNVDGSVIADTYKTGFSDRFAVNEAIPGLQEGLQLMPIGSRFEFVVPADLAWGKRGVGNKIGPNATLIFDIRLIKLEK